MFPIRRLARPLGLFLLAVATALPAAAAGAARPDADAFFQNARLGGAELSPDGRHVAFTTAASRTERMGLAVLDLATMKPALAVRYDTADVNHFHWVNDERLVFDLTDRQAADGDIDAAPGLFAVNADGSRLRQLVDRRGRSWIRNGEEAELLKWNTFLHGPVPRQDTPDVYVVQPEEYDQKHVDYVALWRLDTRNGHLREVKAPLHSFDWVFDTKGELRVVVTTVKDRHAVMALDRATGQWQALAEFGWFDDQEGFEPHYIDEHDRLFVTARRGRDTRAVYTYDLEKRQLAGEPFLTTTRYDLSPEFVQADGRLLGLRYLVDAEVTQWIDPAMEALQARIDKLLPTTVNRISVAARGDGRYVLVKAFSDRVPGLFLLFDTKEGKLTSLGNSHPEVDPKAMSALEQVKYTARDGLEIPAWLTVPRGVARKDLPLVLLVHGGPYVRGRDWRWDPEVQFLAARGYAVLEPEFRGSTGYGERLFTAGWKQWGRAMQDDLADGVKWAVAQGIADPKRVCIAGASYGGYAVLMGLVNDPAMYRCGVDWVGVTDIGLLYSLNWSDLSDDWKRYGLPVLVGDPVKDAAQLKATSPIENAAKIRAPLLLAYGGEDLRVPIEHGEKFRDAIGKVPGSKVDWVTYPKEGHGWRAEETKLDFWNRVARFLDEQIGPGATP